MPKSIENRLAFSGGEFSPLMDARVDHPKYSVGCRQMQNMISLLQGGATRRPGTIFKAASKFTDTEFLEYAARLMSFEYSPTTSFILEFGHEYIRFFSNRQPVTLSSAPTWVSGAAYILGNFVEDAADANNIYYCTAAITGALQPNGDPAHWVKQSIYEIPSPYVGCQAPGGSIYDLDVWRIVPTQINDTVYLVHPSYPPYKLERFGDTDWRLSAVRFITPALLDVNATGVTLAGSAVSGTITLVAAAPAWVTATYYDIGRSVSSGGVLYTCVIPNTSAVAFVTDFNLGYWAVETIFTAGNIGGSFEIGHVRNSTSIEKALTSNGNTGTVEASGVCTFETYGTWSADADLERSDDSGGTWVKVRTITSRSDNNGAVTITVAGSALFRIVVSNYASSTGTPRAVFTIVASIALSLVKITAVASAYSATAEVVKKLYATTATNIWAEGAWSIRRGNPRAATAYQQRMIYGGSSFQPQRIWGTKTDDLENFALGEQTEATDGLAFDLAAVGRGGIQWLIGQVDLFAGFAGAEWIINAGGGALGGSTEAITATDINAGEHSAFGSAVGIPPAVVGNTVLYTQRTAKTIQQMTFSVYTNKYMSTDLTTLSEHLFGASIAQMAYQPQFRDQGIVWAVNKAGALLGMTYEVNTDIISWHRHVTGVNEDAGTIEAFQSTASIPGRGTDDDEVWVVVNRGSGKMIELLNPVNWETSGEGSDLGIAKPDIKQAVYVDSGVSYTGNTSDVFTGLDHLEGVSVIGVLNGNQAFGPYIVAGGKVTVGGYEPTNPNTDVVHIGIPMPYALQSMRMDVDPRAGVLMGIRKALSKVFLNLFNSLGGKVEGSSKAIPIEYRSKGGLIIGGPTLYTGIKELEPSSTQSLDPTLIVKGEDPFPITVLATTVRIGIQGSA